MTIFGRYMEWRISSFIFRVQIRSVTEKNFGDFEMAEFCSVPQGGCEIITSSTVDDVTHVVIFRNVNNESNNLC